MSSPKWKADYLFNLNLLGDAGVGKTSLLSSHMGTYYGGGDVYGCYTGTPIFKDKLGGFTLGFPFSDEIKGKKITFYCRDIFDIQKFLPSSSKQARYFKVIHGIFLVFDLTNYNSFVNLDTWIETIFTYKGDSPVPIALIGNKIDLIEKDQTIIKQEEIEQLQFTIQDKLKLSSQFVQYYQTSCRTGFGVEELYSDFLIKIIVFLVSN